MLFHLDFIFIDDFCSQMRNFAFILFIGFACIQLLASFEPQGKQRKITFANENLVGHIKWVKVTHYGAVVRGAPIRNTKESWTYNEYGHLIENDKYDTISKPCRKTIYQYFPNGDLKETMDSTAETNMQRIRANTEPVKFIWRANTFNQIAIQKYTYRYDALGSLLYSAKCTYYNGRYCECTYYIGSSWDTCRNMTKYYYDSSGKILEELTFNGDTIHPCASTLFRYNKMGQFTEKDESKSTRVANTCDYGNNLEPDENTVLKRDTKGRVIDKTTYWFNIYLTRDEKTTFDNSGDTLETVQADYAGKDTVHFLKRKEVKQFIKNNHTLQDDVYDANGMLTDYTTSHFDLKKHLSDKEQFHITYNNAGTGDTVMVYHIINDNHFNRIEDDRYTNDGKVVYKDTYQYNYDRVGNWVEQLLVNDSNPEIITEREIHYLPNHK